MEAPQPIGWITAAFRAAVILVVATVLLVIVPNLLLTKLTGLSRSACVAVASTWFVVAFTSCAWTLRRLQRRDII